MSSSPGFTLVRVVMFVDISGSSRLYTEMGDAPALQHVRACLKLLAQTIEEHGGRTIKSIGDGMMCEFEEADHALEAAAAMQQAVEDWEAEAQPRLSIRIGCHLGNVIEKGGDLFGDAVNIAARVASVAGAGQIITTPETIAGLTPSLRGHARPLNQVSVKGRVEALNVFDYLWRQQTDHTVVGVPVAKANPSRMRVVCGDRETWLDRSGGGAIVLGRHAGCELNVNDPAASRQHATIELRGDKFVLVDHSANGTYVSWAGAQEVFVNRGEMILPPRGLIGLGSSTLSTNVTLVEFSRENSLNPGERDTSPSR